MKPPIRWKPALVLIALAAIAYAVTILKAEWRYEQQRSLQLIGTTVLLYLSLLIWWLFFSRTGGRAKLIGVSVFLLPFVFFRLRGLSGDFIPIFEFRFGARAAALGPADAIKSGVARTDFPQLLGPNRDAVLTGIALDPDWKLNPPQLVWKQPVGAAWSGFSIVGERAVTQEQAGENEAVVCYDILTGKRLWATENPGKFSTTIAGEGPRATPTISGDRVFTFGATAVLRALSLSDGKVIWSRDLAAEFGRGIPDWGFASSPLVHEGKVIVSIGGGAGKSLVAYSATDGRPVWTAGDRNVDYSSPFFLATPQPQIVVFNHKGITSHNPQTGAVLWDRAWGTGYPNVARPIPVGGGKVFFTSGYGVGSALLDISAGEKWNIDELWKTPRFQSKFSNPVLRDGHIYGVSDGIFACLDITDGKVKWKGGRFGHGQGLLVGDLYLQMTERGELVLLQPTPESENELGRVRVFDAKTWNTIALSGDLLLVRNDQEAACLRLKLKNAN